MPPIRSGGYSSFNLNNFLARCEVCNDLATLHREKGRYCYAKIADSSMVKTTVKRMGRYEVKIDEF